MLLSVPGPIGRTGLRLPSHPGGITIPSNINPNYIPVRMRRKLFVINDHMAVGVAGSALHIGAFIDDLTGKFGDKVLFTNAEIRNFLNQYDADRRGSEILENVAYVIVVEATDWRGSLTRGLNKHSNIFSNRFGRVVAIGTGSDSVVDQILRLDSSYKSGISQPRDAGSQFPEFGTLAINLGLLANVYWTEFRSLTNLFEACGGAYDLIYQDPTGKTNRTVFTEYDEEGRLEVFFRSDHEEWLKEQAMSNYHQVFRE